jgi:hypothetical protein
MTAFKHDLVMIEISASVGFIKKKFVAMHGHMNIKLATRSKTEQ